MDYSRPIPKRTRDDLSDHEDKNAMDSPVKEPSSKRLAIEDAPRDVDTPPFYVPEPILSSDPTPQLTEEQQQVFDQLNHEMEAACMRAIDALSSQSRAPADPEPVVNTDPPTNHTAESAEINLSPIDSAEIEAGSAAAVALEPRVETAAPRRNQGRPSREKVELWNSIKHHLVYLFLRTDHELSSTSDDNSRRTTRAEFADRLHREVKTQFPSPEHNTLFEVKPVYLVQKIGKSKSEIEEQHPAIFELILGWAKEGQPYDAVALAEVNPASADAQEPVRKRARRTSLREPPVDQPTTAETSTPQEPTTTTSSRHLRLGTLPEVGLSRAEAETMRQLFKKYLAVVRQVGVMELTSLFT
ncbi:MAG: hypothetical protein EBZ48_16970 [Proteobacteria bacterium]|nr:hypothetical protein [Pseudomonadota bacterium]